MTDDRSTVTVELDVFSGRPNPSWVLGPAEAAALQQLVHAQDAVAPPPAPPPGLGYRGFVVTLGSGSAREVLRIRGGSIERQGQSYRDPGRTVEKYLIQTMPDELRSQFESILPR